MMNQPIKLAGRIGKGGSGEVRPGLLLTLAVALIAAGTALWLFKMTRPNSPAPSAEAATERVRQEQAPVPQTRPQAHAPAPRRLSPPVTAVTPPPAPATPPSAGLDSLPRTQETVQAASAITRLTELGSTNAISVEQAQQINEKLKQIVSLGAPAAAAIYDFLQKDLDLSFGKQTEPVGAGTGAPSSLRLGLIEALGKIGGTEAVSVAADVLQKTLAPSEIGLLAKTLEQQAPGEYRDAALAASREALAAAAKNPANDQDVAGLFQILRKYGDSSVISDLQNLSGQWRYYSLITVAGLPDGQGVPALIQMATQPGAQASGYQQIATQMLAELAPTNPEAQKALLDQAKAGQVVNWTEVALALTGARLDFRQDLFADENTPDANRITQTHHVVYGNQNFRTLATELPPDQIEQNRALLDQLMTLAPDPAAQLTLQRAKEKLTAPPPPANP